MRIASVGHALFAVTIIGLGILALFKGHFSPVWDPVPKTVPGREILVYLTAIISLASGIGLLFQRTAVIAARVLLASLLIWLLVFRLRDIFHAPRVLGAYYGSAETAVMVAAAWVLYVWFANGWDKQHLGFATGRVGLRIARVLFGFALIVFGLAHFVYLEQTAPLVPRWLPWHTAWAYITGTAFLAAGIAVLTGVCARLAAALAGLQLALFTLLVWVPIVAAGSKDAFQWSETILSWTLTTAVWVIADSYRQQHGSR